MFLFAPGVTRANAIFLHLKAISWPLPGSHIPNQFVVQVLGAGAKLEAAVFLNHAIIVGFYDTDMGFILAAPSVEVARFSGHPNLYYSKYTWSQLGDSLFDPSPQTYWSEREIVHMNLTPSPFLSKQLIIMIHFLRT